MTLENIIIEAINTIRRNKKRPDVNSILENLSKELHNSNITSTSTLIDTRLTLYCLVVTKKVTHT